MVGTQALIAFQSTTGAVVYQYPVTGAVKGGQSLIPGDLTLNFTDTSAVVSGAEMTIFSTLNLKAGDSMSMQYVWGQGRTVDLTNNAVGPHSIPISGDAAVTNIDLLTAQASTVELPNQKLKNVRHQFNYLQFFYFYFANCLVVKSETIETQVIRI